MIYKHQVDFVTPINDQYYMSYYAYWRRHGRESPKNHREIAAMWEENDPEVVKDYLKELPLIKEMAE